MEQTMEPWTSDQDLDLRGYAAQALVTAFIFNSVAAWVGAFPGHGAGGFWPIYVPDPSGPLTSQHLFDPYRYVDEGGLTGQKGLQAQETHRKLLTFLPFCY